MRVFTGLMGTASARSWSFTTRNTVQMLGDIPFVALTLATFLALHGLRKRSLSPSGAIAAFIVGLSMMAVPLHAFGVSLITFYLVGSRATKVGKQLKAQLEEGHQDAGYRNAAQVLCNSFTAFVATLLWTAAYVPDSIVSYLLSGVVTPQRPYDLSQWCPLIPPVTASLSRPLLFITLGHFACCLGTPSPRTGHPLALTSHPHHEPQACAPGTNGGMSATGTLASLAGGLIMGLTLTAALLVESSACRAQWSSVALPLVAWGTLAGGLGSLLDSLMGATIQRTLYSTTTKRILTDESSAPSPGAEVKRVSGWDILSNNQVNLFSSIITACAVGALA
ncbi:Transmembrane protein 19 [Grifola frondosa]|uniref:Transmembrane protein 19 n=1 Tax=Grifola frondosa TaxID=5627 RepID=A0A1C7MG43_GRIFR|nr:Transmembrane protein 19 [Grifola frondosa]